MRKLAAAAFLTAIVPTAANAQVAEGAMLVSFLVLVIPALLALAIYFAPTLVAARRKHLSVWAIFIFNLCLGWTFLGWVLGLVWALTSNPRTHAERYSQLPNL